MVEVVWSGGDKHILFSASYDGGETFTTSVRLDSGNGAFHTENLRAGEKGLLYFVWLDERAGTYRIYMNRSKDYGRTWLKEDVRINKGDVNVFTPFMEAYKREVWIGWLEQGDKFRKVKIWRSDDAGETWSDEMEAPVPEEGKIYTPKIVQTEAGLFIIYFVSEHGIMVSLSKDNGMHWEPPSTLPGTKETGSSGFQIVKNSKGDICLGWPGPLKLKKNKADIYVSCSNDGGINWSKKPSRLDTNTIRLTHSLAPDMAMDEEGRVVVVWQDTRNIRTNIYLNYSLDGGRTWLDSDILVNKSEGVNISQFPSVATDGEGRFLVTWQIATLDNLKKNEYVLAYEEIVFACPNLPPHYLNHHS
ncbi:MAG: glycoside hydrolase, partial [Candidatus Mariimomonas ferrooxydans]